MSVKLRVHGTVAECIVIVDVLRALFVVRSVSTWRPDRPPSVLGRVYLEVELPTNGTTHQR